MTNPKNNSDRVSEIIVRSLPVNRTVALFVLHTLRVIAECEEVNGFHMVSNAEMQNVLRQLISQYE